MKSTIRIFLQPNYIYEDLKKLGIFWEEVSLNIRCQVPHWIYLSYWELKMCKLRNKEPVPTRRWFNRHIKLIRGLK